MKKRSQRQQGTGGGFTLVEIIVVVVILAIASLVAIPVFSSGADMQVRSAANKIAADLDYAKGLAITHQKNYTVVFTPSSESYQVQDETGTPVKHPMRPDDDFIEDLDADRRLSKVDIISTTLDSDSVTFDYLGAPYSGGSPLSSVGQIAIQDTDRKYPPLYVKIQPVTGYVTITP